MDQHNIQTISENMKQFGALVAQSSETFMRFYKKVPYTSVTLKDIVITGAPIVPDKPLTFIDAHFDQAGPVPPS